VAQAGRIPRTFTCSRPLLSAPDGPAAGPRHISTGRAATAPSPEESPRATASSKFRIVDPEWLIAPWPRSLHGWVPKLPRYSVHLPFEQNPGQWVGAIATRMFIFSPVASPAPLGRLPKLAGGGNPNSFLQKAPSTQPKAPEMSSFRECFRQCQCTGTIPNVDAAPNPPPLGPF